MPKRDKCATCIYQTGKSLFVGKYSMKCDYLEITGRMRPCEPGEECTEYIKRKTRRARNG